jgi:hypothetical protein
MDDGSKRLTENQFAWNIIINGKILLTKVKISHNGRCL